MVQSRANAAEAGEKKRLDQSRITHYLKDDKITKTRDEINLVIKQGRGEEALTISLMDTKKSFAVLLRILLELDASYKRELAQAAGNQEYMLKIQKTLAVIDDALCIFGETHRVLLMTLGKLAYLATLKSKTNQIVKELEKLVIDVNNIEMTAQTKDLWKEMSLWLYSIYKKTEDKVKCQRPCHRVIASVPPEPENLDKIIQHKHHANYIRYSDKLYYVNLDEHINTEIKLSRDKLVRFDVSSTTALSEKDLKEITGLTQHKGAAGSHLVVMTSPEGDFDMDDLSFLKPKSAYVRRGNDLFYVNKETKELRKLGFNKSDGLKKFDEILKVQSGLRELTNPELDEVTLITGHAHSRAKVVFLLDDETYETADPEDAIFKPATGGELSKMKISLYYLYAVQNLNRLIEAFENKLKPVDLRKSAPAQSPVPLLSKTKTPTAVNPVKIGLPRSATVGSTPVKPVVRTAAPVVEKKVEPVVVKAAEVKPVEVKAAAPVVKQPIVSITKEIFEEKIDIKKPVQPVITVTAETYEETVTIEKPAEPVVKEPVVSVTAETYEESVVTEKPVPVVVKQPVVSVSAETFEETIVKVHASKSEESETVTVEAPVTGVEDLRFSDEMNSVSEDPVNASELIEPAAVVAAEIQAVADPEPAAAPKAHVEGNMSTVEEGDKLVYRLVVSREHEAFLRDIAGVANDMMANPLVDELKQNMTSNDKVKISTLAAAVTNHHLTPTQKASLANFRDEAVSEINKYIHEKKTLFNYVKNKAHTKSAQDCIDKLWTTEDAEEQLQEVLRLNELMRKLKSIALYQYTSNALLMARERLCPNNEGHHLAGTTSIIDIDDESVMLQIEVAKEHPEFLQEICEMVDEMTANPLVSLLKRHLHDKDDRSRISNLQVELMRFDFNPVQRAMLCNFKKEAINVLETYLQGWWPTHYQKAKKAVDALNDDAKAPDPRAQIIIMINLYRDMYVENSDKLYKGINELLINTLEVICPKPANQQVEAAKNAAPQNDNNEQQEAASALSM